MAFNNFTVEKVYGITPCKLNSYVAGHDVVLYQEDRQRQTFADAWLKQRQIWKSLQVFVAVTRPKVVF